MPLQPYHFEYRQHHDISSLSASDQALLAEAERACSHAYAPYSHFKVGAAIRNMNGQVTIGSNQENEAFPIGQCAERVALYGMVHSCGRVGIDTMAIVVDHEKQSTPASPCGSCRQMLLEYRRHQATSLRLLLATTHGKTVLEINDVADLLPLAFNGTFLGQ